MVKPLLDILEYYDEVLISKMIPKPLQMVIDYAFWYNFREYYLEMEGIAQIIGVPARRIVVTNYAYEFVAYCTSLLAK